MLDSCPAVSHRAGLLGIGVGVGVALLALAAFAGKPGVQNPAASPARGSPGPARTFATLQDALRDSTLRAGQTLRIKGAARAGSGHAYGSRFAVRRTARPPDGVLTFAHPHAGLKLVRRWDSTRISAEWAGARPDYEKAGEAHTDNTDAFSRIEAFIREHPGTTVQIGAGVYGFDRLWTFDNPQRFTIQGEGKGVTELVFAPRARRNPETGEYEYDRGLARYGMMVRGGRQYEGDRERAAYGTFRDLTLRGHANAPDAMWTGIDFRGQTSHMTFENVEVAYFSGQGIRNASHRDSGDHFRYLDSAFHHISTWDMLPSKGVGPIHRLKSHAVVRGNRFWASGVNGAAHAIYFDGYGENIRVTGNAFDSFYPGWDPEADPRHEQIAFCDVKVAHHDGDHPKDTGDAPNNALYEGYNIFKNVVIKDNVFRRSFSNMMWNHVDSLTATGNRFEDTMLKITQRATNVELRGNTFTRSTDYERIEGVENGLGVVYLGANSSLKIVGAGEGISVTSNAFRDAPERAGDMPFAIEVLETDETSETVFAGNRITSTRGFLFRSAPAGAVRLTGNTVTVAGAGEGIGAALYVRGDYGGRVRSDGNTYRYERGDGPNHGRFFRRGNGAPPLHSFGDTFVVPPGGGAAYITRRGRTDLRESTIRTSGALR